MLDQPVPNPLATNPKFNTTKVFATIGIVLVAFIILAAGYWFFISKQTPSGASVTTTKVSSSSASNNTASPATSSAAYITKDEVTQIKEETPASDTTTNPTPPVATASKPTCSFFSPIDMATLSGSTKVIVSLAATSGYTDWNVTLNGTAILGNAIDPTYLGYNWDTTQGADGTYTLVCNITDSLGNKGATTETVTVKNN